MRQDAGQSTTVTVHVPIKFALRGGQKAVMTDIVVSAPQPRTDNALLKALARAHRWRHRIEGGDYASITELAKAEWINESYACRLLRLTLLSPAIVNNVLNGRQKADLTLKDLTKPFPIEWQEQLKAFRFGSA
jgi:hypothetical protein